MSFFPAARNRRGRGRCCLSRWRKQREGGGGGERGSDKVRLEALAGRLSRRGGSTPPEGDFGACLRGYRGTGRLGTVVREGIAKVWEGWWRTGWKSQRGPPLEGRPRRPPRDCFPEAGIACQAPLTHHPLRPHFAELALSRSVGRSIGPPAYTGLSPYLMPRFPRAPSPAQSVSDRE